MTIDKGQMQEISRIAASKGADSKRIQQIISLGFFADLCDPRATLDIHPHQQIPGFSRSIRENVRKELGLTALDPMVQSYEVDYTIPLEKLFADCNLYTGPGGPPSVPLEAFTVRGRGVKKLTWRLVHLGHNYLFKEVADEISSRRLGFRHATLQELLCLRKKYPKGGGFLSAVFERDIYAFGSQVGNRYPVLHEMGYFFNHERYHYALRFEDGMRRSSAPSHALIVAPFDPMHFSPAPVMTSVKKGDVVEGQTIAAVGKSMEFGIGNKLTAVRFKDGKYGIVSISEFESSPTTVRLWIPTTERTETALADSVKMPRINHGIRSDVIHVRGEDAQGGYLLKLFYNEKRDRPDDLHR